MLVYPIQNAGGTFQEVAYLTYPAVTQVSFTGITSLMIGNIVKMGIL